VSAAFAEKGVGRPDAVTFGRALTDGLGVNLLVSDVAAQVEFLNRVLDVAIDYWDDDFALCRGYGGVWMLHHDRTYRAHPYGRACRGVAVRGIGIELRLYGCDPDAAVERAQRAEAPVVDAAADKPHGVREAYIVGPDGFVWVPTRPQREDR